MKWFILVCIIVVLFSFLRFFEVACEFIGNGGEIEVRNEGIVFTIPSVKW